MRTLKWLLVALAATLTAQAYVLNYDASGVYINKWQTSPINLQVMLSTTRNLSDGSSQASCVLGAMDIWNAQLGTQRLTGTITSGSAATSNGINEITMASTVQGQSFGSGVLAVTLISTRGNSFAETDLLFNAAYTWDSYRGALQYGKQDMRRVAIHELGHVLGLDHPDESGQYVTAIMNSHVSDLDTLAADDIAGVQFLYGIPGLLPKNDDFTNATVINLSDGSVQLYGSNVGATYQDGEPRPANTTSRHSVWWSWTAPSAGAVTMTTSGSCFDTVLGVYTGASLSSLTEVVSNDDEETTDQNSTPSRKRTSKVTFDATAGTTYRILVDGWGSANTEPTGYTGQITLNISVAAIVPPAVVTNPADQTVLAGSQVDFGASFTGKPTPTLQWQRRPAGGSWSNVSDDANYAGTATGHLAIQTMNSMDGDQFWCVATNTLGTTTSAVATLHVNGSYPRYFAQPSDGWTYVGIACGFRAIATGADYYQWYFNGVAMPGMTDRHLILPNPTFADAGDYYVVASNRVGGSTPSNKVHLTVRPLPAVISVSAIGNSTVFVRSDGSIWNIGNNIGMDLAAPMPLLDIDFGSTVVSEVLTSDRGLALLANGQLMVYPAYTVYPSGSSWSQLDSGVIAIAGNLGVGFYIKTDDTLWAVGNNANGQLGDGTNTNRVAPVQIASAVHAVVAAPDATLFIDNNSVLWGMGSNARGQLGLGDSVSACNVPTKITEGVSFVATTSGRTFFVKNDGSAWAMGDNAESALGDGSMTNRTVPVQVMSGVLSVAAGTHHTLFLKSDHTLWIAGNASEQFGYAAAQTPIGTPVQVASDVIAVAAGADDSLYVKSDGSLWGTGSNAHGQVGAGAKTSVVTPFVVATQTVLQPSYLVNISSRANGGTGDNVAIGGFVVSGSGTKRLLLRAVGPTLTTQGLGQNEVMADPTIELHDALNGNKIVATIDNWSDNADPASVTTTAASVGAQALSGSDAKSAATVIDVAPGVYSFLASGKNSTSGIVLIEVYDADTSSSTAKLVNISTRANCSTGNSVTIGGFVVSGNAPKHLLLRAVGPSLTTQGLGVTEVLQDPVIEVHDALHGNVVIATNDNWGDNANASDITAAGARVGATPLAASDTTSSAMLITLQPGVYSFVANGKNGTSGIVLVEVYDAD